MAPKRKSSVPVNAYKPKRSRDILSISEKVKILDLVEIEKKSYAEIGRMYGKNESSIRELVKNKEKIRATHSIAPQSSKITVIVRNNLLLKVEKALICWMEEMSKKMVTVNNNAIREKALNLYKEFQKKDGGDAKPFTASKGWLHRFKNRFNCSNVLDKNEGDTVSSDEDAPATFPEKWKQIIRKGNYVPKQIFNCKETGLFWKKMPNRTFISKNAKEESGFKAWKDRLTVILCGNAAGHMIKPGVIYHQKNPHALKNKNKKFLPVFWQCNPKACITSALFTEWFHQCFIPEVKDYLERQKLSFKVLLVIDNAPGHPQSISIENENVQVLFLPSNLTPQVQPLDQGIINCVKASYTRLVFEIIRTAIDADPNFQVMYCWKSFTIAHAITYIRAASDELTPETVKACWKNLLNEAVHKNNTVKGSVGVNGEIKKIIKVAKEIGGEGFIDMTDEEVEKHIAEHDEVLTNEEFEDLIKSSIPENKDEEVEVEPVMWTLEKFGEVFQVAQILKEKIMDYDPMMERSIKVTRKITEALQPFLHMFNELKRQKQQLPVAMFFHKGLQKNVPTNEDQTPSTSAPVVIQHSSFSFAQPSLSYEEDHPYPVYYCAQVMN